ncbi:MAG: NAD(P)-binding protein [Acidobacteria bacterium]|nr:NAD(P)-binding protein [Acidobacteriota bacterium]
MSRTAVIVGAGIGGLAAALALRRAGWNVRIIERAVSPRELGYGLGLAPNAVAALRDLDVADVVLSRSFVPRRGELRRQDGTVLKRAELPPRALGGPLVMALRPALHGALLDAVGADAIALSTVATGFTTSSGGVTVHVRSSVGDDVVEGDLLVGADGVGSAIRQRLHPSQPPPRPCGIVAVRGVVHGAVPHLGDCDAVYYLGRGVESVLIRASDTGIYWFLSIARDVIPEGLQEPKAIVAHLAPQFDETWRGVTAATTDLRFDALVDRDPLPFWGTGAVTLLGDAAHPLLPQTGQGAAQALVDAVALGKALAGNAPIEPALRAYERERLEKTAALVAQGRRTARVMGTTNWLLCYLREWAVRLMPIQQFVRLSVRVNRRAGTDIRH